jgi:bifunctional DNA-binding transcriptional regulator/antitoxin component of YhaV-PrlF toxin-antitoxin module
MDYTKQKYIKSFSKGQITIPKEMRDGLGLGDVFWLKLYVENEKIVAEPLEKEGNSSEYQKKLLNIDGSWFDLKDYKKMRGDIERRFSQDV